MNASNEIRLSELVEKQGLGQVFGKFFFRGATHKGLILNLEKAGRGYPKGHVRLYWEDRDSAVFHPAHIVLLKAVV